MKRDGYDERNFAPRSLSHQTAGLPMEFGPDIRTPAPSAPGSETSREAAALVSVDGECLRCLIWFARQAEPRTRYELAHAVYPVGPGRDVVGIGPACGRTNDLVALGYLEELGRQGKRATLRVTERGRAWLDKRRAA